MVQGANRVSGGVIALLLATLVLLFGAEVALSSCNLPVVSVSSIVADNSCGTGAGGFTIILNQTSFDPSFWDLQSTLTPFTFVR